VPVAAQQAVVRAIAPDSVPKVSGTYVGTWKQTGGGKSPESGSVTITVHQSGDKVSGTIAATYKSHTNKLPFTGTVKASGQGASIELVVTSKYGDGEGKATVVNSTLSGTIVFPGRSGAPKTTVTFTTKKQ